VTTGAAVGTSAGWLLGLAAALAAFGLGGWIGYVLGRDTAQDTQQRNTLKEDK
jgi:membrane protein YqaA with SNARE-associated domain